jgi:tetraacyldisaccharide 4'-kinase
VTIWLCEHLRAEGRMPAVVSRGYKATTDSPADELALVRRRCPATITVASPDRFEGGRAAIEEHKADVIVLDDGFQHRRLARDLDIVLIDATCPFGYGRLLPRGLLREPVSSLHRADVLLVTRWDQVSDEAIEELRLRLRAIAPDKTVLRATHRPAGFVTLGGEPIAAVGRFRRPLLFAAIARPAAFEQTVRSMDIEPAAVRWYPDHHVYGADDAKHLSDLAARHNADAVLTTEKDAVKISRFGAAWPCPAAALRIDIAFLDDDDTIMARLVREAVLARDE